MDLMANLDGQPGKRVIHYMQEQKVKGHPIVGIYCGYTPKEAYLEMVTPSIS